MILCVSVRVCAIVRACGHVRAFVCACESSKTSQAGLTSSMKCVRKIEKTGTQSSVDDQENRDVPGSPLIDWIGLAATDRYRWPVTGRYLLRNANRPVSAMHVRMSSSASIRNYCRVKKVEVELRWGIMSTHVQKPRPHLSLGTVRSLMSALRSASRDSDSVSRDRPPSIRPITLIFNPVLFVFLFSRGGRLPRIFT